jgi:protein gp37
MSATSAIEWTDATWNPLRGCTKVSPGCKHCYAETLAERFRGVPGHPFEQGFDLRLVPEALELPLRWRTPRRIFVNSMSDLFHEDVPEAYIGRVFDVMRRARHHAAFQVLTKRSARLRSLAPRLPWPGNVWIGVSVESESYTSRIDDLVAVGDAAVRFLSVEPLLGPIPMLPLHGIDWVIVGGESGRRARPMNPEWVLDIRDQCGRAGVPFFFKQWGGVQKSRAGRILDGRTWDEMPSRAVPAAAK